VLLSQIESSTVQATLRTLGLTFYTKDVSRHANMRAAHPVTQAERNYHTVVGSYLARHRQQPRIEAVAGRSHRHNGRLWHQLAG
jgi:hypothetical protein